MRKSITIMISSLMMKMIINPNKRSMFYPQLTLVIAPHQNPSNNHLHPKRILMLTSLLEVNKSWMIMISKKKFQIKSLKKKYHLPNNKETLNQTKHLKISTKIKMISQKIKVKLAINTKKSILKTIKMNLSINH